MAALSENFRFKLQIAKRLDDSLPASRHKNKKNQRKDIQELIHNIKRYERYTSTFKLQISEGDDVQIIIYEIVFEFMGMNNKVVSVDKGTARDFSKTISEVLRSDTLNEDAEDIKITPDTGNGEVQVQIRQESSTYTGISAMSFLYIKTGFQMTAVMNVSLSIYINVSHQMNLL